VSRRDVTGIGDDALLNAQFALGGQFANLVPNTTPPKKTQGNPRVTALLLKRIDESKSTPHPIPEAALGMQAMYDRLLVWQFPDVNLGGEKYAGTTLYKAEETRERIWQSIPRGIIDSAGLGAMDAMKANGVDVGHIVHFVVNSPYRLPLDDHDKAHVCLMRAGDLVASEDLARALDEGGCRIEERGGEHVLVDRDGKVWKPRLPWMEE
jgi:hypothetical protein